MPKPVKLVYASTSGNTEIVMETVAQILQQADLAPTLHRAEQTPVSVIEDNSWFVFGTSTWEHGALNPFFRRLLSEMKNSNLAGKQAAFVGCGDTRYEPVLFCEGIEKVKKVWVAQGGSVLGEVLKINGEPYGLLGTDVKRWAEGLLSYFGQKPKTSTSNASDTLTKVRSILGV